MLRVIFYKSGAVKVAYEIFVFKSTSFFHHLKMLIRQGYPEKIKVLHQFLAEIWHFEFFNIFSNFWKLMNFEYSRACNSLMVNNCYIKYTEVVAHNRYFQNIQNSEWGFSLIFGTGPRKMVPQTKIPHHKLCWRSEN